MSFEVSNFYWDQCAGVRGSERLVILALADYCNESGWCFPSVPELARRCQLSDRGTQKILAKLAAGGHIAVEANQGMHKTRGSPTHKYHLLAYQRIFTGAKGEQLRSPIAAEKGEQTAQKGEQIDVKGEPARSPDPYRSINDPNTTAAAAPPATPNEYQKVVAAYHNEIGTLTPIVEEEIKAELTLSSPEWVIRAIGIAAMRNKRRWAYAAGILRRWHAEGYDGGMEYLSAGTPHGATTASKTSGKSTGYGRQRAPATSAKGQSIEDYAK